MTHRHHEPVGEFLIARVIQNSGGSPVMEQIMHGSWSAVMENIRDSKVRADAVRADQEKDQKIASLEKQLTRARARADSAEAEVKRLNSDAVIRPLLTEAIGKLDGLAARMDGLEREELERLISEITYPPGHEPEVVAEDEDPDDPAHLPGHDEDEPAEPHTPSGELHTLAPKANGKGDNDQEPLARIPLPRDPHDPEENDE